MPTTSSVIKFFPSAKEGFTTTLSSSIASGATTVPLNSVSGYNNGDVVCLVIEPTSATAKQVFTGTMDTANVQITGVVWTEGTNQTHASGATVVDYATATHISIMSKGMLVQHGQDGTHSSGISFSNATLITPTIANFANAQHSHTNSAGGATINGGTAIQSGTITGDRLASDTVTPSKMLGVDLFGATAAIAGSAPSAGSGQFYMQAGSSTGSTNGSGNLQITFPSAFPNGLLTVLADDGDGSTSRDLSLVVSDCTAAHFSVISSVISGGIRVNWLAVGF